MILEAVKKREQFEGVNGFLDREICFVVKDEIIATIWSSFP